MSDRTVLQFALAGLLAVTLTSSAVAQAHNPWRGNSLAVAPMPRAKSAECRIEFGIEIGGGPMLFERRLDFRLPIPPQQQAKCNVVPGNFELFTQVLETPTSYFMFSPGQPFQMVGPGCVPTGCCPSAPPASPGQLNDVRIVRLATGSAEVCSEKFGKLTGTWVRDLEVAVIAATFSGDEMKLCMSQNTEAGIICFTITADFVLKDGLVHGVVTGVDVGCQTAPASCQDDCKQSVAMELAQLSGELQALVDCPFSFRVKHTTAGVMVSNLKFAVGHGVSSKETAMLCGMYKPANGKVPTPAKPQVFDTWTGGLGLPNPSSLKDTPVHAAPGGGHPLPHGMTSQECPTCGVRRIGIDFNDPPTPWLPCPVTPAGSGSLPTRSQLGWCPTQPANVPAGEFSMMAEVFGQMLGGQATSKPGPAPLPTAQYINQAQPSVAPASPCPVPPGCPAPPCPVMPATGYAPQQPVAPTLSAPAAKPGIVGTWYRELGSKLCVIQITPDHFTVTISEATEIDDGKTITGSLMLTADYQMTRDGTTAVGLITGVDVKLEGDSSNEVCGELLNITAETQKALENKPFAMTLRMYGDTLVIGSVRMPELAESRLDFHPAAVVGGRYKNIGDQVLPKPKPSKSGVLNRASSDPNNRIRQLLNQSEGPSQINNNRRFWFKDKDSYVTPERVHGGIY